jgi:hypothetical protein
MIAGAAPADVGNWFQRKSGSCDPEADAEIEAGGAEPGEATEEEREALTDSLGSRAAAGGKEQTTGKAGRHRFICDRVLSSR